MEIVETNLYLIEGTECMPMYVVADNIEQAARIYTEMAKKYNASSDSIVKIEKVNINKEDNIAVIYEK